MSKYDIVDSTVKPSKYNVSSTDTTIPATHTASIDQFKGGLSTVPSAIGATSQSTPATLTPEQSPTIGKFGSALLTGAEQYAGHVIQNMNKNFAPLHITPGANGQLQVAPGDAQRILSNTLSFSPAGIGGEIIPGQIPESVIGTWAKKTNPADITSDLIKFGVDPANAASLGDKLSVANTANDVKNVLMNHNVISAPAPETPLAPKELPGTVTTPPPVPEITRPTLPPQIASEAKVPGVLPSNEVRLSAAPPELQNIAYKKFLASGSTDTKEGFLKEFANDTFNATNGEPVEIGGTRTQTQAIPPSQVDWTAPPGPGYQKFASGIDNLVKTNTLHPEDANILKDLFKNTNDDALANIDISPNGRFSPSKFGRAMYYTDKPEKLSFLDMQKGLADKFNVPGNTHGAIGVFLHEYGHIASGAVLNPEERAIVKDVFDTLGRQGRQNLFKRGLGGNVQHHAKNPNEFVAESFREYVLQNKVPAEKMRPLLDRLVSKFVDGLLNLVRRGQTAVMDRLTPVFEKMLSGERNNPLAQYMETKPTRYKEELRQMIEQRKAAPIAAPVQNSVPQSASLFPSQAKPVSTAPAKATPIETAQNQLAKAVAKAPNLGGPDGLESLPQMIESKATNVKEKVNALDYMRTPQYVLDKIGLGDYGHKLRDAYDAYLQELPKNIDKITEWSKQVTPEGNAKIFQSLDGKDVQLTPQEEKIAGEVRTWLGQWADRLDLPKDKRITDYITHIFPPGKGGEIPDEMAKIIQHQIPGSVYDPYLLQRMGAEGYIQDTWRALDAYVKTATRKVFMDPALEGLKEASANLEVSQANYIKRFVDRVNMRPTEIDTLIDNGIKSFAGYRLGVRPTKNMLSNARMIISRAKLGLSFTSAFKNITQGVNTFTELGAKYTAKGYYDFFTHGAEELKGTGVLQESFIQDRNYNAIKKFWEKADKVIFYNFETTEALNRGAAYYGAKAKGIAEGMTEDQAKAYGKQIAGKTQFLFGSIDTPVALASDIMKTAAQFQTFTLKQIEFLGEKAKAREYASLARYVAASALVFGVIGKAFGMNFSDIIPSLRFGAPPVVDLPVRTFNAVTGAPDAYGRTPTMGARLRDVGNAVLTDVVPAGAQINRTIPGIQTVSQGKKTTSDGNFQYRVKQTPSNYVRGALFGPNNLPEAQTYFDKKNAPKKLSGNKYNI